MKKLEIEILLRCDGQYLCRVIDPSRDMRRSPYSADPESCEPIVHLTPVFDTLEDSVNEAIKWIEGNFPEAEIEYRLDVIELPLNRVMLGEAEEQRRNAPMEIPTAKFHPPSNPNHPFTDRDWL